MRGCCCRYHQRAGLCQLRPPPQKHGRCGEVRDFALTALSRQVMQTRCRKVRSFASPCCKLVSSQYFSCTKPAPGTAPFPLFSSRHCCACPFFRLLTTPSREGACGCRTARQAHGRVNAIMAHLRAAKLGLERARRQDAPELTHRMALRSARLPAAALHAPLPEAPSATWTEKPDAAVVAFLSSRAFHPQRRPRSQVVTIEFRNARPAMWPSKFDKTKPLRCGN